MTLSQEHSVFVRNKAAFNPTRPTLTPIHIRLDNIKAGVSNREKLLEIVDNANALRNNMFL